MGQKLIIRTTDGNRNSNSDILHQVEFSSPGSFRFDNQGRPVAVPRLTMTETWDLFPVVTSVSAGSAKTLLLAGANAANNLVSRAANGGIRLTASDNIGDAMILQGVDDTSAEIALSESNCVQAVTQVSVQSLDHLHVAFGLFSSPSSTIPGVTTGNTDCAFFLFDPHGEAATVGSGISSDVYANNWLLVTMADSGTAEVLDSGVRVIADIDYELKLSIGTDMKPVFHINGENVGTGGGALSEVTVKTVLGVYARDEFTRSIESRYIEVSRLIG